MLPLQFFGQNLHFAVSLLAALVFFAVFWLYFDAWLAEAHKAKKDIYKWLGFLTVSISFLLHATVIEQSDLGQAFFGSTSETISIILRVIGYIGIIIGQLIDPLMEKPKTEGIDSDLVADQELPPDTTPPTALPAPPASAQAAVGSAFGLNYALPVGALAIAVLYWRRATTGLERHLKPVALAFFCLFGYEVFGLAELAQNTTNPNVFNLVKPFGLLWIISHGLLLLGVLILGRWVWHYLTERFLSQLFMIFTSVILVIFMLTTVSFTFLLMHNIQNDSLDNLQVAVKVLGYALDAKKSETLANAESVAQNPQIVQAVENRDHKALAALESTFLADKKQSTLTITSVSAQVLLRADDPSRWGDSISSDTSVRRALIGTNSSTIISKDAVLAPQIYISSTVPIRDASQDIVGTATVGLIASNTLVDGIKNSTGLDSAIYSGHTLSATTLVAADGKTRQLGLQQNSKPVNQQVLKQGQTFKGVISLQNRSYLAVYAPLKDADNSVVGMMFIGQPQTSILRTAGRSIELTFVVAAILLMLAIVPAYLVARALARQLE